MVTVFINNMNRHCASRKV